MTWKCPECGFDANEESATDCRGGCGYVRIPSLLTLASVATGKEIRIHIDTRVGKRLLGSAAGEEGAYASECQFQVFRSQEQAGWMIRHEAGARNPTFLDGTALGAGPGRLNEGAVISIGPEKCRMSVKLAYQ